MWIFTKEYSYSFEDKKIEVVVKFGAMGYLASLEPIFEKYGYSLQSFIGLIAEICSKSKSYRGNFLKVTFFKDVPSDIFDFIARLPAQSLYISAKKIYYELKSISYSSRQKYFIETLTDSINMEMARVYQAKNSYYFQIRNKSCNLLKIKKSEILKSAIYLNTKIFRFKLVRIFLFELLTLFQLEGIAKYTTSYIEKNQEPWDFNLRHSHEDSNDLLVYLRELEFGNVSHMLNFAGSSFGK